MLVNITTSSRARLRKKVGKMSETLLFFGDGTEGSTIWQSDGTHNGTNAINPSETVNETPASTYAPPPYLFYANSKLYAQSDSNDLLVWTWDSQTHTWSHNHIGGNALNPQGYAAYKGLVYFNGSWLDGFTTAQDLFSTNGSQTTQITTSGLDPSSLAVAFGKLFFSGRDSSSGNYVLWSYNGETAERVPGINIVNPQYLALSLTGPEVIDPGAPPLDPPHLVPGPSLFMSGQDSTDGPTWLYQYDGTKLHKIAPASLSGSSSGLQPYDLTGLLWVAQVEAPKDTGYRAALFFSGVNEHGKVGLWMSQGYNGTTHEITTPTPQGGNSNTSVYPFNLTALPNDNGYLYFTAYDTYINGFPSARALFAYDPEQNQIAKIIPNASANQLQLDPQFNTDWEGHGFFNQLTVTALNNDLYFSAKGGSGNESVPNLWRAHLNSQGNVANPTAVYTEGNGGLQPFALTAAAL